MSSRAQEITSHLKEIWDELEGKARLIAVSKTFPIEDIGHAYGAGQFDFGENKVQELKEKSEALSPLCPDIRWHFIGHLQSNKLNMLLKIPNLVSIHSIDNIKLLNKLLSKNPDKKMGIFLQVNTSKETEKSGFESVEELQEAIAMLKEHPKFYLQGLMTIGKIRTENFEEDARRCFGELINIRKKLGEKHLELSMGMSQDYPIALKSGTDWVRVGSKIFGHR